MQANQFKCNKNRPKSTKKDVAFIWSLQQSEFKKFENTADPIKLLLIQQILSFFTKAFLDCVLFCILKSFFAKNKHTNQFVLFSVHVFTDVDFILVFFSFF